MILAIFKNKFGELKKVYYIYWNEKQKFFIHCGEVNRDHASLIS